VIFSLSVMKECDWRDNGMAGMTQLGIGAAKIVLNCSRAIGRSRVSQLPEGVEEEDGTRGERMRRGRCRRWKMVNGLTAKHAKSAKILRTQTNADVFSLHVHLELILFRLIFVYSQPTI
jgi:hypothetical protein